MSAEVLEAPGPEHPADRRPPLRTRLWHAYLYGSTPVLVLLAILSALVVGAILIVASDEPTRTAMGYFFQHPVDVFSRAWHAIASAYIALFKGSIFNTDSLYSNSGVPVFGPISDTLTNATPLILAGLSVGVAFRAGLFNIGAQGQLIAGAIGAGYVAFAWSLPPVIHVVAAVVAGAIGGAVWGGIAGWLKAHTGAHEVITTIMLNYLAAYLLAYLLTLNGFQRPNTNQAQSRTTQGSARLPHLLGTHLRVHAGLFIALAAAVFCWWLLTRSTLGFRLRAVGANPFAARTAGMGVERSYLVVMVLAGALAGLAGAMQILGVNTSLDPSVSGTIGFDAITVALLGLATPQGIVLAGLLYGALQAGSVQLLANTTTPQDLVEVLQSVIVLFIAAPGLIRLIYRLRASRGGVQQLAKGWNG
jgi:general nucleoside transport system permease protein